VPALKGLDQYRQVEVIYWLNLSRRGLVLQCPANDAQPRGTFSLRSPVPPKLVGMEGATVLVRGLDCLDGTPLIDLKPDRCAFTPIAAPQAGDFQVGDS
jgi:tRNA (Thr-GGU) A37 N-methylase